MNTPDKDGISKREHYKQVEKQIGRQLEETKNPTKFPRLLTHVWSAFLSLSQGRSMGFSGPNPLSYQEIDTWATLMNEHLTPMDVQAIKALDREYMRIANG